MRSFLAALAIFVCLSAGVPAATPGTARTAPAHNTQTPSDAQIEATLRAKLAKSKIGKDGFRFKVQHGIVTWEGSTNVVQHKGSATRMARTAGAVQVINNVQVSDAAKAKAGANLKKAYVEQ